MSSSFFARPLRSAFSASCCAVMVVAAMVVTGPEHTAENRQSPSSRSVQKLSNSGLGGSLSPPLQPPGWVQLNRSGSSLPLAALCATSPYRFDTLLGTCLAPPPVFASSPQGCGHGAMGNPRSSYALQGW